jgi:hypothetical protein
VRFQATEDQIESIIEHSEGDYGPEDIAELVFGSRSSRDVNRVIGILHEMNPYVDSVAVERALQGDRDACAALTALERDLVLVAARKRRQAETEERREWIKIFRQHAYGASGGEALPHPRTCPAWMADLADALGFDDPMSVMKQGLLAERRLGG